MFQRDACPSCPGVNLQTHFQAQPLRLCRIGQLPRTLPTVHRQNQAVQLGRKRQRAPDTKCSHHGICDKNVPQAARRHRLGLAHLGAGDALRTRFHLHACKYRHLMGLDVRTQRTARSVCGRLHGLDVPARLRHVEDHARRLQHRKLFLCQFHTSPPSRRFMPSNP